MMRKPVLVIKFGSASITTKEGKIDERVILEVARQTAQLQATYNIVLVSSGAVAAGKKYISNYTGTLSERKAAAALGNPLLLRKYSTYFKPFGIALAQSLCERQHFANRNQFLQLKATYQELWKNGVIPVANENDVVSNKELKFSDNDELATLIAVGFGAEQVLFSTSVPGVLDANGEVVREIAVVDKEALGLARKDKSSVGLGGMVSKLNFARLANQMGIQAVIFSMQTEDGILKAVKGETGTVCRAQIIKVSSRRKWLASGGLIKALVTVDGGAEQALRDRKSLLAVGITAVNQSFETGEMFQIVNEQGEIFAVAQAKTDVNDLASVQFKRNVAIAHADDIVLL